MSYKRFDRHECFTPEIMDMTMDAIIESEDMHLTNMLYGLYDGYLYDDLLEVANNSTMNEETKHKVRGIIKAIEMYMLLITQ